MIDLFTNYDNLSPEYTPNNQYYKFPVNTSESNLDPNNNA